MTLDCTSIPAIFQLLSLPNLLLSNFALHSISNLLLSLAETQLHHTGWSRHPQQRTGGQEEQKSRGGFSKMAPSYDSRHPRKFTSNKCKDEQIKTGGKEMKSG